MESRTVALVVGYLCINNSVLLEIFYLLYVILFPFFVDDYYLLMCAKEQIVHQACSIL